VGELRSPASYYTLTTAVSFPAIRLWCCTI